MLIIEVNKKQKGFPVFDREVLFVCKALFIIRITIFSPFWCKDMVDFIKFYVCEICPKTAYMAVFCAFIRIYQDTETGIFISIPSFIAYTLSENPFCL